MSEQSGRVYEFGPFVLDPDRDILLKGGEPVALPPKAFALLVALVRAGGRTVTKDEILREIWPDTAVEEQNVGQNIHLVRKALSDEADRPSYVVTVPRRGYRFAAAIRERCPPADVVTRKQVSLDIHAFEATLAQPSGTDLIDETTRRSTGGASGPREKSAGEQPYLCRPPSGATAASPSRVAPCTPSCTWSRSSSRSHTSSTATGPGC
jgi:DNA-binding winged helix-turn-helix (wHTH) protein